MSAVQLTRHGGLEMLAYGADVPAPEPRAGEVLIRVRASAVNNTEVNRRTGWYSRSVRGDTASAAVEGADAPNPDDAWSGAMKFPRIQGADCCGALAAVSAAVDAGRIGERVLARAIKGAFDAVEGEAFIAFGSERDGAFAEYTTVAAEHAVRIDSPLSDVKLSSFPCAFSTAEGVIQRAALGAERILITGASEGVGSAAVQLAKRRGANVTAVTSMTKAGAVAGLGADATLTRDEVIPTSEFDVILDLVGGPCWPDLVDALRPGARYVTSGAIAGPIVELDLRTLYLDDGSLIGSTKQDPRIFADLVGYIEAGELQPIVVTSFPLHDVRKA